MTPGQKKREPSLNGSQDSINDQDDDTGGGIPAKGGESDRFSASSDKGMMKIQDQT